MKNKNKGAIPIIALILSLVLTLGAVSIGSYTKNNNLGGSGTINPLPIKSFLGLNDTPDTYVGQGSKIVSVKSDATGLEFSTAGSSMVYPGVGIPLSTGSAWGTSITDNSSNWNTAYGWGNHASAGYVTGTPWTSQGYLTDAPSDGSTYGRLNGTWSAVVAGAGDMILNAIQSVTGLKTFDKDKIAMKGTSTGTNVISVANTSATSYTNILPAKDGTFAMTSDLHSAVTLGTPANGLGLSTQELSLGLSSTSTIGALSDTDWDTFNNKLGTVLNSTNIFVGNGSNIATGVALSGDAALSNTGVLGVNKTRLNVRNETGTTIASTKAVYTASFNNLPLIALADNTDEAKHGVLGVTIAPINDQANGFIASSGQFDAETNSWVVGTTLYLSTSGALTSTQPTSGAVKIIGTVTVQANYPTGKILLAARQEEHILAGGANTDTILRTGDSAGTNKFSFRDYANSEVASINSDGALTAVSLIKSGGTSSQFLKADGTVDSSTYLTSIASHASTHAVGGTDAVFPADPGADKYLKFNNTSNLIEWADTAASGANTALSNLASVAINTTLLSDTDNTDSLGTTAIAWSDLFLGSGGVITFNSAPSTPDITLTHSADLLTLAGGNLALGANSLTLTGSIGATGAGKITKIWGVDAEFTNLPTINGGTLATALSLGTAATTAATDYATAAQGTLATNAMPKGGGTFTGNVLFTDNTLDIGASGATRPRTGYFGTSLVAPTINATTGFQINGAATSGKILVGNGTNFVASTPTFPNASATSGKTIRSDGTNWIASTATLSDAPSTAGKLLVSDGTNWITSTPTFPNASATSGKIIKSDGTNWLASTETYAAPGTSGNVMTSDGTNWTSATSSSTPAVDVQTFTSSGTWTKPAGTPKKVVIELWGGGGGGGGVAANAGGGNNGGGGGGGGAYNRFEMLPAQLTATVTVTIPNVAAGGVGGNDGAVGGNVTFGTYFTGYGGGGGGKSSGGGSVGAGGGGGGQMAAGVSAVNATAGAGGGPVGGTVPGVNGSFGGGGGGNSTTGPGGLSFMGGGAGGGVTGPGNVGGLSTMGGGGGGGGSGSPAGTGGTSIGGGAGGNGGAGGQSYGSTNNNGADGTAPGGGGGGAGSWKSAVNGGAGGKGQIIVTTYY